MRASRADVRPLCSSCGSSGKILTVDRRTYVPCDAANCAWRDGAPRECEREQEQALPVMHVPPGSYPATVTWQTEKPSTAPEHEVVIEQAVAMPSFEEILARAPAEFVTGSLHHVQKDITVEIVPHAGGFRAKSLIVWPPSPDLLIVCVSIDALLFARDVESVTCWRSPIDLREACFSRVVPLVLQLHAYKPVDYVALIVSGQPKEIAR